MFVLTTGFNGALMWVRIRTRNRHTCQVTVLNSESNKTNELCRYFVKCDVRITCKLTVAEAKYKSLGSKHTAHHTSGQRGTERETSALVSKIRTIQQRKIRR